MRCGAPFIKVMMLLNWTAMSDYFFLYCPQYCEHTPPLAKANIFSSSSEQWNTSDSYFDNLVWKEGKKWVGGLCDNVVSSASAPFSVLSLKLVFAFSGSMPLNEMIPEAASICLFLAFLFFFFKIIKLKLSAAFPFVYQSELHAYWEGKIKSSTLIFLDQRLVKKKNLIIFNLCISYLNKLFTMPAYIIYLIVILFRDVVERILKPHIQMMCFDRLCSLV